MLQYIVYLYIETCTSILRQYSFNTACVYVYIYIYMYACISIYICPMFDGIKASALPRDIAVVQSAP